MLESAAALFDVGALLVVMAGTVIATAARSGWRNLRAALFALARLRIAPIDCDANRAALARTIAAVRAKGHLCSDVPLPPDQAFASLVSGYLVSGSIEAMHEAAIRQQTARETARDRAVRVLEYAGEIAPVFGLVGTLFAISQLAPTGQLSLAENTMQALATAVLSSLYGVLTAHIVYIPLAGAIERRGLREEEDRLALIEWFEHELSREPPRGALSRLKDVA
jgi:chemotaxis protein MotA